MVCRLHLEFVVFILATGHWAGAYLNKNVIEGFPASITCEADSDHDDYFYFYDGEDEDLPGEHPFQCIITDEYQTLFNKTIAWKESLSEGIYFDATEEWRDRKVNVTLLWQHADNIEHFEYIVKFDDIKNSEYVMLRNLYLMDGFNIGCHLPGQLPQLSEEQFNKMSHSWYKGNEKIEKNDTRFKQTLGDYQKGNLGSLKAKATSYEIYPGEYTCVTEYNGQTMMAWKYKICVSEKAKKRVAILPIQQEYVIAPGEDLTVSCTGSVGSHLTFPAAQWYKPDGKRRGEPLCSLHSREARNECNVKIVQKKFCQPASEAEILAASDRAIGSFNMTFDLHNLTYSDSGVYQCYFMWKRANFNITVRDLPKDNEHERVNPAINETDLPEDNVQKRVKLTISVTDFPKDKEHTKANLTITAGDPPNNKGYLTALLIVAVLLLAMFLIFIYARKSVKYFYKKNFGRSIETDRTVAYLFYGADVVSENCEENPLRDVRNWLASQNYSDHDPNDGNPNNDAGENAIEQTKNAAAGCLSMIVFLTPQLLNEDNLELLKAKKADHKNNGDRNFPIVFISDKRMKESIEKRARLEGKAEEPELKLKSTFVTVRDLMKKNTVVTWNARDRDNLHRSLYVALPKVRRSKRKQTDDAKETLL